MKTFEIGQIYSMRSPGDHDCIWTYKIIARTAATVTAQEINHPTEKKAKTYRINKKYTEYRQAETIFPLGQYSLCPTLSADKIQ